MKSTNDDGVAEVLSATLVAHATQRFGIVASRFNELFVERLVHGAIDALVRHGADRRQVTVVWVPGAWEIPLVCQRLLEVGKVDAVIACGVVIRGDTGHYDHVASWASNGIAQVGLKAGRPVTNAVLTVESLEQASQRCGSKAGNKGAEAAVAAIEMLNVLASLG